MFFLTLLFVSTAIATPLLGTEQCARGPPYWCQNVKTASICGAVSHCQQNVWNKPQMKAVPCDLCKEILIVVDQILKENATEEEILGYLEKACQIIPDEGLAAECKEMVDNYYPVLMGIIKGELENPSVVCGAIGLCQSEQAALAELQVQQNEQLLSNEIPKVDLSQNESPFLLNVPLLLYPQNHKDETPKQETPKANVDVCRDCVTFLTDAQTEAKTNSTFLDGVIEHIENQCDLLGPSLSSLCREYVSQYSSLVVEQFMSMQPKDICIQAGFCTSEKKTTPLLRLLAANTVPAAKIVLAAKTVPAAKMMPALKLFPATKMESTNSKTAVAMVRVRDPPLCTICEAVMKQLETMLEDKTTEEEVIHAVEKVCMYLPSSLRSQCKDLVDAYGGAIIELLVQQADPKTICTVLALCNEAHRAYVVALDKTRFKVGGYCEVCKTAVAYIDRILEKNSTESQIEEAVRKVCSFLPDSMRTECDQLVEQYEPVLVQLLLQMLDPDFVCMNIGACPGLKSRLLGTEECTRGPSYWCKNMETAALCSAVEHCKRHVWV